MADRLDGQKMEENGLNGLNRTELNAIRRAKRPFNTLFRLTKANMLAFLHAYIFILIFFT
jgi:hypothetical protein